MGSIFQYDRASTEDKSGFYRQILLAHDRKRQTCIPGIIEAYDRASGIATVQPLVDMVSTNTDGSDVAQTRPTISIPVRRFIHGGFIIDAPLFVGDTGWIVAGDRASEEARKRNSGVLSRNQDEKIPQTIVNKGTTQADDFSLTQFQNGFFIPDCWAKDSGLKAEDGFVIKDVVNGATIRLLDKCISFEANKIQFKGDGASIDAKDVTINVESVSIDAKGVILKTENKNGVKLGDVNKDTTDIKEQAVASMGWVNEHFSRGKDFLTTNTPQDVNSTKTFTNGNGVKFSSKETAGTWGLPTGIKMGVMNEGDELDKDGAHFLIASGDSELKKVAPVTDKDRYQGAEAVHFCFNKEIKGYVLGLGGGCANVYLDNYGQFDADNSKKSTAIASKGWVNRFFSGDGGGGGYDDTQLRKWVNDTFTSFSYVSENYVNKTSLDQYYTKGSADSIFLTKNTAQDTYATKSALTSYATTSWVDSTFAKSANIPTSTLLLSDATPKALGTATAGTSSTKVSREDHVHPIPTNMGTTNTAQNITQKKTFALSDTQDKLDSSEALGLNRGNWIYFHSKEASKRIRMGINSNDVFYIQAQDGTHNTSLMQMTNVHDVVNSTFYLGYATGALTLGGKTCSLATATADTTATDSMLIPHLGLINDKFVRKTTLANYVTTNTTQTITAHKTISTTVANPDTQEMLSMSRGNWAYFNDDTGRNQSVRIGVNRKHTFYIQKVLNGSGYDILNVTDGSTSETASPNIDNAVVQLGGNKLKTRLHHAPTDTDDTASRDIATLGWVNGKFVKSTTLSSYATNASVSTAISGQKSYIDNAVSNLTPKAGYTPKETNVDKTQGASVTWTNDGASGVKIDVLTIVGSDGVNYWRTLKFDAYGRLQSISTRTHL